MTALAVFVVLEFPPNHAEAHQLLNHRNDIQRSSLSDRVRSLIPRHVTNFLELSEYSEGELRHIKGMGTKAIAEIANELKARNLKFANERTANDIALFAKRAASLIQGAAAVIYSAELRVLIERELHRLDKAGCNLSDVELDDLDYRWIIVRHKGKETCRFIPSIKFKRMEASATCGAVPSSGVPHIPYQGPVRNRR